MSGVNESKDYLRLMGTASGVNGNETERDSAAIGGIVAVYYLGTSLAVCWEATWPMQRAA